MPLKDLCRSEVVCIGPKSTISDAARLMKDRHVGDLIVVESPKKPKAPIGVLTDRDLVTGVIAEGRSPDETRVEEVMNRNPRVASEGMGVMEATSLLEQAGIRRLPVVDTAGNLTGIVSVDDLYELLSTEFSSLARISSRQMIQEGPAVSRRAAREGVGANPPPYA